MRIDQTLQQNDDEQLRSQALSLKQSQPPTHVPGYEPRRFLGSGAYGEVWVAIDGSTGRQVAIKFYAHRGGLDWSLLSREVEKLAFLSADRYVVQLLDVGWDAEPPYYVMEYIERGSLEDLLRREKQLSPSAAVTLFRDVAIGLLHAHGKGVLHCDLKPANVLLDQDSKPRLLTLARVGSRTNKPRPWARCFIWPPSRPTQSRAGCALGCLRAGRAAVRDAHRFAAVSKQPGYRRYRDRNRSRHPARPLPQLAGTFADAGGSSAYGRRRS